MSVRYLWNISRTEVKRMDIVSVLLVLVIVGCFVAAVISERKK